MAGALGRRIIEQVRDFPATMLAAHALESGERFTERVDLAGPRHLYAEVIPLEGLAGTETSVLMIIRDATVQVQTEKVRRDFVTNVSHELKTPLAGLQLLADTLQHAILEDPEQEWKKAAFCHYVQRPKATLDNKWYIGYSMTTERYHYVQWHHWDNDAELAGKQVAVELYDHQIDPDEISTSPITTNMQN